MTAMLIPGSLSSALWLWTEYSDRHTRSASVSTNCRKDTLRVDIIRIRHKSSSNSRHEVYLMLSVWLGWLMICNLVTLTDTESNKIQEWILWISKQPVRFDWDNHEELWRKADQFRKTLQKCVLGGLFLQCLSISWTGSFSSEDTIRDFLPCKILRSRHPSNNLLMEFQSFRASSHWWSRKLDVP